MPGKRRAAHDRGRSAAVASSSCSPTPSSRPASGPSGRPTDPDSKAPAGAVVVLDVKTGEAAGHGLLSHLRPRRLRGGHQLLPLRRAERPRRPRPAQRPGGEQHLFTGLDVQAAHRLRSPDEGGDHARRRVRRPGLLHDRELRGAGRAPAASSTTPNRASYGRVDLRRALSVSSDAYFYRLGELFWNNQSASARPPSRTAAQAVRARRGHRVQLPTRAAATVAGPALPPRAGPGEPQAFPNKDWFTGDNVNLAIGQGELLVTPLQLANAYATLANGGTQFSPSIARAVIDRQTGQVSAASSPACAAGAACRRRSARPIVDGLTRVVSRRGGHGVEGLRRVPARPVPGGGQDRYRRGGRQGRHRPVRRVRARQPALATPSSPCWRRPASGPTPPCRSSARCSSISATRAGRSHPCRSPARRRRRAAPAEAASGAAATSAVRHGGGRRGVRHLRHRRGRQRSRGGAAAGADRHQRGADVTSAPASSSVPTTAAPPTSAASPPSTEPSAGASTGPPTTEPASSGGASQASPSTSLGPSSSAAAALVASAHPTGRSARTGAGHDDHGEDHPRPRPRPHRADPQRRLGAAGPGPGPERDRRRHDLLGDQGSRAPASTRPTWARRSSSSSCPGGAGRHGARRATTGSSAGRRPSTCSRWRRWSGSSSVGSSRKGAQAWFSFGPLQLQPSEPAKVALIVVLAAYLSANRHRLDAPRLITGADHRGRADGAHPAPARPRDRAGVRRADARACSPWPGCGCATWWRWRCWARSGSAWCSTPGCSRPTRRTG